MVVALVSAASAQAGAEPAPVVLVLDSPGVAAFDEFVAVLRVQVHGSAGVRVGPPIENGGIGERVEIAAAHLGRTGAVLVVWIEPAGEATHVVYAVDSKADRALIEVVRVPASESQNAARVMAIKVSNLTDLLLTRAPTRDVAVAFAPATAAPMTEPPAQAAYQLGWSAELAGVGALSAGDVSGQVGFGLAGGASLMLGAWRVDGLPLVAG